ncbi:uncharacterized protein LOC135090458 [Scylla paramamosain]|uniref:uncharacterized protein LOC135090458 n=1 Tax=Scylla paramamosain TaxID=85552 RepID=UPI003082F70C
MELREIRQGEGGEVRCEDEGQEEGRSVRTGQRSNRGGNVCEHVSRSGHAEMGEENMQKMPNSEHMFRTEEYEKLTDITKEIVEQEIDRLKKFKTPGPDEIYPRVLKEFKEAISEPQIWVEFRNAVAGTNRSRFEVLSSGVLLLNRGAVGLFVLTPDGIMDELINTGLPEGEYWDIVSGWNDKLVVQADGTAWLTINNTDVPFVAFCVDCGPEKFSTTEASTLKTTPLYSTSEEMISETSTSTNERPTDYSTLATETTEYSTASDTATNETVTGDYTSYGPSSYYSTSYEPSSDYPSSYKSSTDYSTTPDHSTSYEPSTLYSTSYEPSSDYSFSYEPSSDYSSYEPSSDYSSSYEPSSDYSSSYERSSDYSSSYEPSSDYSSSYEPSSDYSSSYEPSSDYSSSYEPSSDYSSSYEPSSDYSSSYEPSSDYSSSYEPSSDYSSSYEPSSDYSSSNKPSTDYPSSYKTTTNSFSSYRPSTVSSTSYEPSTDHSISQQPSTNYSTSYATTTHFFPTTTESPYKSTVIFMKKKVYDSQYVFLRGGLNEEDHPGNWGLRGHLSLCSAVASLSFSEPSQSWVVVVHLLRRHIVLHGRRDNILRITQKDPVEVNVSSKLHYAGGRVERLTQLMPWRDWLAAGVASDLNPLPLLEVTVDPTRIGVRTRSPTNNVHGRVSRGHSVGGFS